MDGRRDRGAARATKKKHDDHATMMTRRDIAEKN